VTSRFAGLLPERLPERGELVQVRSRRWLVEDVASADDAPTVVRLACAEDDAQGEQIEVLWDFELDRRILDVEGWENLAARGFDDPGSSRPSSTHCAGTPSQRRTRASFRRPFAPASRSTPTRWSRFARRFVSRA